MEKIIRYLENMNLIFTVGAMKITVVSFAKLEAGDDWSIINHCHSDFEFHLVPLGRGYVNIEGNDLTVNRGEFYITGPYVMHSQVCDKKMHMEEYCLECEIAVLDTQENNLILLEENLLFKDILLTTYPRIFKDNYNAITIFEQIIKEDLEKPPGFILQIQSLIANLIISFFRSVAISTDFNFKYSIQKKSIGYLKTHRIINFIELNYKRNLTLHDVSKALFLSPSQINRVLLKNSYMTFHKYLMSHRIEIAKKLIQITDLPIKEIAYESGFSSNNYMYQAFKNMGLPTPADLRLKSLFNHKYVVNANKI